MKIIDKTLIQKKYLQQQAELFGQGKDVNSILNKWKHAVLTVGQDFATVKDVVKSVYETYAYVCELYDKEPDLKNPLGAINNYKNNPEFSKISSRKPLWDLTVYDTCIVAEKSGTMSLSSNNYSDFYSIIFTGDDIKISNGEGNTISFYDKTLIDSVIYIGDDKIMVPFKWQGACMKQYDIKEMLPLFNVIIRELKDFCELFTVTVNTFFAE